MRRLQRNADISPEHPKLGSRGACAAQEQPAASRPEAHSPGRVGAAPFPLLPWNKGRGL